MTTVEEERRAVAVSVVREIQAEEEGEERKRATVVVLLGVVALVSFFFGVVLAPVLSPAFGRAVDGFGHFSGGVSGGVVPVIVVGQNVSQVFYVSAHPGAAVASEVKICNVNSRAVAVEAWVESPPKEVRVFVLKVGSEWFGVRYENQSRWYGRLEGGQCVDGRLEVVLAADVPVGKHFHVVTHFVSRAD